MILFRVLYSISFFVKLLFYKVFGRLENLHFSYKNHCGKGVYMEFAKGSVISLGQDIGLRDSVRLLVRQGANLSIGDNVFINTDCLFVVHKSLQIGAKTKFGPRVMIFDHDYDFRVKGGVSSKIYKEEEIIIGSNCWIGAGVTLLRGTVIGDNSVVGAGCVLKGKYPSNSLIIQKRETETRSIINDNDGKTFVSF